MWSIASKPRPSDQATVQQTLLAIYQLNPQSFELQNIHSLIPGSMLVSSLAQVSRVTKEEATRVMQAHQLRLEAANTTRQVVSNPAASTSTATPLPVKGEVKPLAEIKPTTAPATNAPVTEPTVTSTPETSTPETSIVEKPAVVASSGETLPMLSLAPQSNQTASDS
ncbi:FimV/HubP family polar landmark protein [Vibrio sp. PP-XX7]